MLDDVVVYASRTGALKENIPGAVQIITRDEIESSGSRDFADLLRKNAGLDMRALNGNPLMNAVYMRGFGENGFGRVKILFDGEELNNIDMAAPDLFSIPLWDIDRVEILHGPSPVLYGDGAVAGVVNVLSSMQDYSRKTRILARAGSYDTYGVNFSTRGGFEEEGILYRASYDYLKSGGYRDRSAYNINTANAGLRKNFENGSTIGLCVNYTDALYDLPGSLPSDVWKRQRRRADDAGNKNRIWKYSVAFDSKMHFAEDQWLYFDAGFSNQRREAKWWAYGYENDYNLYGFYLSPRYVNGASIGSFDNKFTLGTDLRYDRDTISDNQNYAPYPRTYHFDRVRWAVFLQNEFWLTDSLSLIAGARLETIRNRWVNCPGIAETRDQEWIGDYELGLIYRPFEGLKTYMKATRFHRSPFCDELNYTPDGYFLSPEKGTSFDAGLEWAIFDELNFDFNAYAMVLEDEIFYNPYCTPMWWGGWNGYNVNSPSNTRRLGFDAALAWLREKTAEASIRYSAVDAAFTSNQYDGDRIPLVPGNRVRAEAGVWIFDDLEIKAGYTFVSSQRLAGDFKNECEKLKGYSLFDIGLYYTPSWAKEWKASFTMDNIFDRAYCDFAGCYYAAGYVSYYYPACGRSFMFTLSYEF